MAAAAPANWSTATTGTETGPASTATSGTRDESRPSAVTADFSGAMTMIPSTPWPWSRWMAPSMLGRFRDCRLAMLTA